MLLGGSLPRAPAVPLVDGGGAPHLSSRTRGRGAVIFASMPHPLHGPPLLKADG